MKLSSLTYKENFRESRGNYWQLNKLSLERLNLIAGKNATGKTRILNLIHNLAKIINNQILLNGEWSALFSTNKPEQTFEYLLSIDNGQILREQIKENNRTVLSRDSSSAQIYSFKFSDMQEISPPNNKLVLHVRRDKNEYPFLEDLISWAIGVRGFAFANTAPTQVDIPGNPFYLTSLNAVPSAWDKLNEIQIQSILNKFKSLDYNIEKAKTDFFDGLPAATKIIYLKEEGLSNFLKQFEISQGMFRAFSLLTILEFLEQSDEVHTILVDDLGEGLDFERSKKLAELLYGGSLKDKIQFIATSNDYFIMNSVPLNNLTICYRSKPSIINCLNYANSKERFDTWKRLGLNNFDLFSSNFLLEN